jgi:hypothetical protein
METTDPSGMIDPVENDTRSVRFSIEQGYLRLKFSFLLKLFGSNLRDGQGSELLYRINDKKHISSLALIESTTLTQHDLAVLKKAPDADPYGYCWLDILHPDFPDAKDIGIATNKIFFMGMDIELLPDETIRFGDQAPCKNKEAYLHFKTGLEDFKNLLASAGERMKLDYRRTFGYRFEERKMFMHVGFRSAEDKKQTIAEED